MRYLIDTDWVVWWLRGRTEFVARLQELYRDGVALSATDLGGGPFTAGGAGTAAGGFAFGAIAWRRSSDLRQLELMVPGRKRRMGLQ